MRHVADRFTAVLDANVLYPFLVRDVLLSLAQAGLYRPVWTAQIMNEWQLHLSANRPAKKAQIERTARLMTEQFKEAWVEGHEALIPTLELPDPNDRHVLAAAIKAEADVIVTENLKDFPSSSPARYDIEALTSDEFALNTIQLYPDISVSAFRAMRQRYAAPAMASQELMLAMIRCGMTRTAAELQPHIDLI